MEQNRQAPEVTSSTADNHAAAPPRGLVAGWRTPKAASHLHCKEPPASRKAPTRGATAPTVGPPPLRGASPATGCKLPRAGRTGASPFGAAVVVARVWSPSTTKTECTVRVASGSGGSTTTAVGMARAGALPLRARTTARPPQLSVREVRRPRRRLPRSRAGSRRLAQAAARWRVREEVVAARALGETAYRPCGGDEPSRVYPIRVHSYQSFKFVMRILSRSSCWLDAELSNYVSPQFFSEFPP
jgi:hypothetical protein